MAHHFGEGTAPIRNSRIEQARRELLEAISEDVQARALFRSQAEAMLSSFFCSLWNQTEARVLKKLKDPQRLS